VTRAVLRLPLLVPQRRAGAKGGGTPASLIIEEASKILDRLGCFSFISALASIWRMRSRVTEDTQADLFPSV